MAVKLEPFAISEPPVIVSPPLRVEAAATDQRATADRDRVACGQRVDGLTARRDLDCRISADVDRDVVTGRRHRIVQTSYPRPPSSCRRPCRSSSHCERRVRGSSQSSTSLRVLRRERKALTLLYGRVSPRQTCHMLMVLMSARRFDRRTGSVDSIQGVIPETSRSHFGSPNNPLTRSFNTIIDPVGPAPPFTRGRCRPSAWANARYNDRFLSMPYMAV